MKLKKVLAICLVGAMAATLLAGCSSSDSSEETAEDETEEGEEVVEEIEEEIEEEAAEEDEDVEAEEEETESAGSGSSFDGFDDTVTIQGYAISYYSVDGKDEVVDAINEISIPAINVEVKFDFLDIASYGEQIGLMISGGESFDFFNVDATVDFSKAQASGELLDISELVYEYAPETMEMVGNLTQPFWVNGGLYALPTYGVVDNKDYIIMREDILDYLGLTEQAEAMSSWTDFEAIMEAVYEAQDDLPEDLKTASIINGKHYGTVISYNGFDNAADDFSEHTGFDLLGDGTNWSIKVDDDGVVECWFDTDDYLETVNRVRSWYENGWVYKDAANDMEAGDQGILDEVAFCTIATGTIGIETTRKQSTGYDCLCVEICTQPLMSSHFINAGWGVSSTSQEPEAAVAFLNLMYTDPDIENLLVYGIEGRDYELNDEGEAVELETREYQGADFLFPNRFNAYPAEGDGTNFREESLEYFNEQELSPYFGFNVDTDPIANETLAIYQVMTQYAPGLNSGAVDPAETYDEFIDQLYAAGMQTVIDYYQENLDAWLAEQ